MSSYIMRSKPHGKNRETKFLEGYISIGWPCGESLEGKNKEGINSTISAKYPDIKPTSLSMIHHFVQMPIGSIVLTPSIKDKSLIHCFKTISTYKYDKNSDTGEIGNPHYIEVEYLKTVRRTDLPEAIINSLSGAQKTLSNISKHNDILNDFINNSSEKVLDILNEAERKKRVHNQLINMLYELTDSENENVRLGAIVAILEHDHAA